MNLRKAENYSIGLDLGTGSVGWAVVNENGVPYHFKGRPTLGARLFPSAETAANRRMKRGSRRRYERRRQRIRRLREIFSVEMAKVDPEFFNRMKQSRLLKEDRDPEYDTDYAYTFFNDGDFTEKDYYKKYPTIWHLRDHLMTCDEKADIRLIYLAIHNIMKYRGNFLHEDESDLRAANSDASTAAEALAEALITYFEEKAMGDESSPSCSPNIDAIKEALDKRGLKRAERQEKLADALGISSKPVSNGIAKACLGYEVEFSNIFLDFEKQDGSKFKLSNDEKVDAFPEICPDDAMIVFETIRNAYSAYLLADTLRGKSSLSRAMMESYMQHQSDLKNLKGLFRDYLPHEAYDEMFKGPLDSEGRYDINALPKGSYTAYICGESLANKKGCSQEDLVKSIRGALESADNSIEDDDRYKAIKDRLYSDDGSFLAKQRTRSNGAIPYQLHQEEMDAIIENQGRFYPFLLENKDELDRMVGTRIPYYVGPLSAKIDLGAPFSGNPVDPSRKFGWSVRKKGMENAKAYPWNVDEVIDKDESAERFIRRMTGECSYLIGEDVIPRCSLLYEEYCVLNELNGAKWSMGGDESHRFSREDRRDMVHELFMKNKTVSHKLIKDWLEKREGAVDVEIFGTQGETKFESKMSSYVDFCKILKVDSLVDPECPLLIEDIEKIILWNTVFEDRDILRRKLENEYGDRLSSEQISKIVKKRYTGWGRLSRKFLTCVKIDCGHEKMNIMDVLRFGNPLSDHRDQAMVLMEILGDDKLGFKEEIDRINEEVLKNRGVGLSIDDLQGSPALRRSVNQAMRILDEIVGIAGKAPDRICIEVTRDDDLKKKGKRTSTRYQRLEEALKAYKAEVGDLDQSLMSELKSKKDVLQGAKRDEALMLYFAQCGKSLYSGKPLDINRLDEYQVDHIIPQCYIKDDSLDNKALVLAEENQRKLDSLLLDNRIINSMTGWWDQLRRAGLISDKKFNSLTRRSFSDKALKGFINRQLVETSQIVKFVRQLCEQKYPGTKVVSIRASLSSGLRDACGLVKCRELNDFHHAHDAFIACQFARFIELRYPKWSDGMNLGFIRTYVKNLGGTWGKSGSRRIPGQSGFIVDSFMRDGFDRETGEIFKDTWDHEREIVNIKKVLGYGNVFLSRMVEEQTAAMWDETVYSPRDSKNGKNLMALKGFETDRVLDPGKYGGYNKVQQAYFFAFVAKNKKGREKYFFEGVPIHLVSRIERSREALVDYATEIAKVEGCTDVRILREKIPLRQKLELDGTEFYLYGKSSSRNELRPAVQMAYSDALQSMLISMIKLPDKLDDSDYENVFLMVDSKVATSCPELHRLLMLKDSFEEYKKLSKTDKCSVLLGVISAANGQARGCDLTKVGGTANKGYMLKNLASSMERITWIDQSVTGMFERRITFEDLTNGI